MLQCFQLITNEKHIASKRRPFQITISLHKSVTALAGLGNGTAELVSVNSVPSLTTDAPIVLRLTPAGCCELGFPSDYCIDVGIFGVF